MKKKIYISKCLNESLIDLRNSINIKETPENKNRKMQSLLLKKSSNLVNNKKIKELKY